jgi:hypothetical protein
MKKYFISGAMLAGLMSLAACSNDEGVVADNNGAEQQFTITLASSGDRATRAAADRALESEAAGQSIEKVTLVVRSQDEGTDKNKVVYIKTLENWNGTATDYDTNGHGKKLTFTIPKADKLGAGDYVVTAVGYNDGNYDLSLPNKGDVVAKNITATTSAGAEAKEVFAGEQKFTVTAPKPDDSNQIQNVDVTLHRQVAGAYGYFTSIPAKIGETEVASIRMVSRSKNTVLTFGSFNSSFTTTDANVMYMVNGSVPAGKTANFLNGDEANVLFSAKIADWFPGGDKNNDGVYDNKDTNWTQHYTGSYLKGSVFASNFIVPFSATQDKSTLELQLLDATGNVLYAWPVKLDASNAQVGKKGETASADLFGAGTAMGFAETADVFSLFRNHIYSIGIHKQGTDPTNPDKPVPDIDKPTNLSKIQNVVIRVNDNWEALHHMSIDE